MNDTVDNAQVIVRPPRLWAASALGGLILTWLAPAPFLPPSVPTAWFGAVVFVVALALLAWAASTMTRAGSNVPTNRPSKLIVDTGPYGIARNPIYLAMMLGLVGLAIGFDSLWLVAALVIFFLIIRYGVVAREEAYLERKFGDTYRDYCGRVRRWL